MSISQFLKIFTRKPSLENYFSVALPTSDEVKRYKIMRSSWIGLNEKLVKQLTRQAIQECGKKLGVYKQGNLILDHEDEISVLMDYIIFHYRRNNVNVVSRYLALSHPENGSLEMSMLQSMLESFFSIFVVLAVSPGKGVIVGDIISDNELFITDIGLGHSAKPNMMFAANVFPFDKFYMTSGAVLPIPGSLFKEKIDSIIDKFYKDDNELTPNQEAAFAAQVICSALQDGVIAKMKHIDV
ncbi:MAG: hypothetical protein DM484_09775 [Candidatus Methylumidiphilus alinenensis]|uniref:Uncharacterized protein n=1 Tax=Candidatus Methylumidiphilus alinenensis TaxID=2202197 RepID=A0A2W4RCD1_9GAMM|nr:MAG: hypothetical protein DM484_09775 [Candidatus Methylumidiphilus alinenensis]